MQHQKSFIFFSAVLLLLTARGCHSKLMCYVCDHCTKITSATQLITCDESFFQSGGTELPSTMTTTEMSTMAETTTTTMETSTTTTMMTTTEMTTDSTTTPATTSTQSTEPPVPTPPTNVPVETTTALPTPPLIGTVPVMMDQMSSTTMAMPVQPMNVMTGDQAMMMRMNATTSEAPDYLNLSEFRVRQARHVTPAKANGISYHCYTLQLTNNNTMNTQRGCARVTTPESVCGQLEMLATNETSINKCKYCSTNRCNGSSALGVSVVTLLIALVASFLRSA